MQLLKKCASSIFKNIDFFFLNLLDTYKLFVNMSVIMSLVFIYMAI